MSDLFDVKQKVKEGQDWRGSVSVEIDGVEKELCIRQLVDGEFYEVMEMINRDELSDLRDDLPEDVLEEYQDLRDTDDLSEDEVERKEELRETLEEESGDLFETLSKETFDGLKQCAKYAVVPDEEDKQAALRERGREIESEYGIKVQEPDDVLPALNDEIAAMIDGSTNFLSFTLGMKCLVETVGNEGNLET